MSFDFSKLSRGITLSKITEPSTLFDALPNKAPGYGYLRAVQKTVLDEWSARRDERDLVIKTNTGGGKTIVGLLMLQCRLNEKKGPALYLTPDGHLERQVIDEAEKLGIRVVSDPTSTKFLAGEAICVSRMRVLINGRTRFGLANDSMRQPIKVGTIVVDDAHAALHMSQQLTQLVIPSTHQTYTELFSLFEDDLKRQSLNAFMDIRDGDRASILRIPFWAWSEKQESILKVLHPHRNDDTFEWVWPLIDDVLPLCQAVISADAFEITPLCPPIEKVPSFAEAEYRIYLTATLADDSVLVTHFDASPESVSNSIVPASAADLGDRLIIAPQELNPEIQHPEIRAMVQEISLARNVVVLAPSWRKANAWKEEADVIVSTADEISAVVSRLTQEHVGMVVIVNRYDGIDLPDEACRLLIIDDLPYAYSATERREAVALRDSEAMVTRQLQRLEQGMGRGVRSRDDRCVVLLLGARLTQLVARTDIANRLSPATRAQIALSRQIASEFEGRDLESLFGIINQVIDDDAGFRALSREVLVGVTYEKAQVSTSAQHLRSAFNNGTRGSFSVAADQSRAAVIAAFESGDTRLAGWIGETSATYLHMVDPIAAQAALVEATRRNSAVLHPITGVDYQKIDSASPQSELATTFLARRYSSGAELILGLDAVLSDIDWDSERTDEAEDALAELGLHLGFAAQRPESEFGIGSDVLWAVGNQRYFVIEAKTGSTAKLISKKDINQLAGSVNWCANEYGRDVAVVPIMVHPSGTIDSSGTPPIGTRVIRKQAQGP